MKLGYAFPIALVATVLLSTSATADMMMRAASHQPIGVMGDHLHHRGEIMFSYRFMHMDMEGNRVGDDDISPQQIANTVPNRFFGMPNQPPTLRVVPTSMTMQMHMFGMMYAPTDWLTLMAMGNYTEKEMDHITFRGPVGTVQRGTFTTRTSGIGDTRVFGLVRLFDRGIHHAHFNLGLSLPTGSTSERDNILTPTGARPSPRLPYAMQLGTGTVDFLPGITYTAHQSIYDWGAQYAGAVRMERDNGYRWGDKHTLSTWLSVSLADWISASARLEYSSMGKIHGRDRNIAAPVQTADPNNYGGERIDLRFGLNLLNTGDNALKGHRIAIEGGIPLMQDLNGPQMETDFVLTVGWQKGF